MSTVFYRKSRNSSYTTATRYTCNPQHASLSNIWLIIFKTHNIEHLAELWNIMCLFFYMKSIYKSFFCSGWDITVKCIGLLPLTKLVGSTCYSRVCNVFTSSCKKDVLYLKYFLGRSIGTVLQFFPAKSNSCGRLQEHQTYYWKVIVFLCKCKLIFKGLNGTGNDLKFQPSVQSLVLFRDISIMIYLHHNCAAVTYCLSNKIYTDFCIVHAMLCYKCKNYFICQCTILWGMSYLIAVVGAGSFFDMDFLNTFRRAVCK